jgi:hypothetical protein
MQENIVDRPIFLVKGDCLNLETFPSLFNSISLGRALILLALENTP